MQLLEISEEFRVLTSHGDIMGMRNGVIAQQHCMAYVAGKYIIRLHSLHFTMPVEKRLLLLHTYSLGDPLHRFLNSKWRIGISSLYCLVTI